MPADPVAAKTGECSLESDSLAFEDIDLSSGTSVYYAESLQTIGDNLREVRPQLFSTVPRLLEKLYERILNRGEQLTGLKRSWP